MKILLVDDHALVRRGLAHVVRESFPDAEVLEADNAEQALRAMSDHAIEIALVDVRMPEPDGLALLHEIKAQWADIPVIMLTSFDHAPYVKQALAEGAAGYVDPGWDGYLTLELSNVANLPITIYPSMKIGQISFFRLTSPADAPYGSAGNKYQGQRGPTPSRSFRDFES